MKTGIDVSYHQGNIDWSKVSVDFALIRVGYRGYVNGKIVEALGEKLGQSVNLQFSETTFNRIIENIRMVFFPHTGETDIAKFRDLATNSLGYNNLLYIATVFAELELIKDSDIFTILLIEEPEAHLHPQLQVKFIKYRETLVSTLPNAPVIVSTHSPVLASSVKIFSLLRAKGGTLSVGRVTGYNSKFCWPVSIGRPVHIRL